MVTTNALAGRRGDAVASRCDADSAGARDGARRRCRVESTVAAKSLARRRDRHPAETSVERRGVGCEGDSDRPAKSASTQAIRTDAGLLARGVAPPCETESGAAGNVLALKRNPRRAETARESVHALSKLVAVLLAVLAALLAAPTPAAAATDPRDGVKLWVEVDHDGPIHPQEMVILRVHGRFTVPVTLEKMTDPTFDGFRAVRIDHDRWRDVFEDGLTRRAFERVVAVFPQHSGRLVVPPFVHALTVLDGAMRQVKITVGTAPVPIDVVPAPAPAGTWWIAARNLRLTETWTRDPAALGIGESTRRVVTVAADGVFDDQLPPPPTLAVPGLIAFAGPTTRSTRIGLGRPAETLPLREQALRRKGRLEEVATPFLGPIASADWTFDLRPATSAPVEIPEIRIPWFDTESRTLREAVLPGRVVALAAAAGDAEAARLEAALGIDPGIARPAPAGRRPLLAALAGAGAFAATLAAALHLVRPGAIGAIGRGIAAAFRRRARRGRLRRAARAGDVATVRRLLELFAAGQDASAERARTALAVLDRHLYAARGERPADLAALAARIG